MKKRFDDLRNHWKGADRVARLGILVVAGAAMTLLLIVITKRVSYALEARSRRRDVDAGPRVQVALASASAPEQALSLLGEARPYATATLYAKVSGYLQDVRVDKGDSVKGGELLARIESPETSQQYDAALADAKNKSAIAERYKPLLARKLVSQQEADQAFADAQVAQANRQSLERLKATRKFARPFRES
jgi:multidrug efflux pump subunit AcrA (membrane-fusion protein)